jgi:hypothetical protein
MYNILNCVEGKILKDLQAQMSESLLRYQAQNVQFECQDIEKERKEGGME